MATTGNCHKCGKATFSVCCRCRQWTCNGWNGCLQSTGVPNAAACPDCVDAEKRGL